MNHILKFLLLTPLIIASDEILDVSEISYGSDEKQRIDLYKGTSDKVLVWIHGGAYFLGSGADCLSDSEDICRDGKYVVVSMNYRLACFGFLRLIILPMEKYHPLVTKPFWIKSKHLNGFKQTYPLLGEIPIM